MRCALEGIRVIELASELLEAATEEAASFCSDMMRRTPRDQASPGKPRQRYSAIIGQSILSLARDCTGCPKRGKDDFFGSSVFRVGDGALTAAT